MHSEDRQVINNKNQFYLAFTMYHVMQKMLYDCFIYALHELQKVDPMLSLFTGRKIEQYIK